MQQFLYLTVNSEVLNAFFRKHFLCSKKTVLKNVYTMTIRKKDAFTEKPVVIKEKHRFSFIFIVCLSLELFSCLLCIFRHYLC